MSKQNPNKSNLNVTSEGDFEVDYFPYLKKHLNTLRQRDKLNRLVNLIERYREVEFQRYEDTFKDMTEQVFMLLGQTRWEDSVSDYRFECQKLLKILATPEVSKAVKDLGYNVHGLLGMTDRLLDFFNAIDTHPYQVMLLSKELRDFGTDFTDKNIEELTEEYEARLEMALSGRIKNRY